MQRLPMENAYYSVRLTNTILKLQMCICWKNYKIYIAGLRSQLKTADVRVLYITRSEFTHSYLGSYITRFHVRIYKFSWLGFNTCALHRPDAQKSSKAASTKIVDFFALRKASQEADIWLNVASIILSSKQIFHI